MDEAEAMIQTEAAIPEKTVIVPRVYRHRSRWRLLAVGVATFVLIFALIAEMGWWDLTATATNYTGAHFNQGKNGTWLAHTWVGDFHTNAEYEVLANRLKHEQITSVYVHVGPLEETGTIATSRFPFASAFIIAMHERDPNLMLYAWIGQIDRVGAVPGDGQIDFSLPQTRAQIVQTAILFTNQLHFDGIHYDIEPILNNDNHFIDLLDETRQSMGTGKLLSIATPNWVPIARVADALRTVTSHGDAWWTTYYYLTVSRHVDQIVVMLYNTNMPTAPLYESIVQQETAHILRAVERGSASTEVIFGIPTYSGDSRAFHASAENMRTGLVGVISGLNYGDYHTAFSGIAIYPEWLTSDADWSIYDQLWLGL